MIVQQYKSAIDITGVKLLITNVDLDESEYWVYIGNNEPIVPVKNNLPYGWFDKLHDRECYWSVVASSMPMEGIPLITWEPIH